MCQYNWVKERPLESKTRSEEKRGQRKSEKDRQIRRQRKRRRMYDCGESDACVQEKEYCGNIAVMVEEGESEKKR